MASPAAAAIQDWLQGVQPTLPLRIQRFKRPRSRSHSSYPSPPQSSSSTSVMGPATPAKRRRPTTDADLDYNRSHDLPDYEDNILRDDGQTPRAAPAGRRTDGDQFSDTSSQTSSSYVSRTSSPSKQLRNMQLQDDGFALGKLQTPTQPLPASLISLVRDAESLSQGVGVVPAQFKDELVFGQAEDGTSYGSYFHDHIFAAVDQRAAASAAPIVTLPPAKVKRIVDRANLCEVRLEEEASWNMEVHHHILRAICRPHGRRHLIDFMPCTTAKISPEYRPSRAPPKMVDFCLFVDPSRAADAVVAAAATKALNQLCRQLPEQSINHTSYAPLASLPITVSIETKRSANSWDIATLQIGRWQTAQLRCLAGLARLKISDASRLTSLPSSSQAPAPAPEPAVPVSSLEYYVPGIIIQGHDWSLVVTADINGQKTLLSKISVGTTETVLGVYKILAALALLVRWSETIYWPSFQKAIL